MGDVWKGETNDGALWRKVKEMEVKEKERERGREREGGREREREAGGRWKNIK